MVQFTEYSKKEAIYLLLSKMNAGYKCWIILGNFVDLNHFKPHE